MSTEPDSTLTIAALARDEASDLAACFRSMSRLKALTNARTLVVLDSRADQETAAVAHSCADTVLRSEFTDFASQRNKGLDAASTAWLLYIDADERCTPALAEDIAAAMRSQDCAAYRVPRRNILFGREIRHTGWWPDYQIRLLRRDACRYDDRRPVHELPVVNGSIGTLAEPLVHFNYRSWAQFAAKQRRYARLDAKALHEHGATASARGFIGQPLRELKRRLVELEGYKDGPTGVALSLAMALYALERQRQLWLLGKRRG